MRTPREAARTIVITMVQGMRTAMHVGSESEAEIVAISLLSDVEKAIAERDVENGRAFVSDLEALADVIDQAGADLEIDGASYAGEMVREFARGITRHLDAGFAIQNSSSPQPNDGRR